MSIPLSLHAGSEMSKTVLLRIKGKFGMLLIEVRKAMEAQRVELEDVHLFLLSLFQDECSLPEDCDLTKIFNFITKAKLWSYDNYGPLKELAEGFLPTDHPAIKHVVEYESQLSAYYATTKIIDFIKLSELESSNGDGPEADYDQLTLGVKLGIKVKLSELAMSYVITLWKELIKKFNIPPLTAVIKKIVGGSLIITWLVPKRVSAAIRYSCSKAVTFFVEHNVVKVQISGITLYREEMIVSEYVINYTMMKPHLK